MGRYGKEKKKLKMMQLIKILFLMIISTFLLTIPVYANPVSPEDPHPWVEPEPTFYESMMETMFFAISFELFLISWLTVIGIILYNSEDLKKRVLGFRFFQASTSVFILAVNGFLGGIISPIFILVSIVLLVIANIFISKKIKRFKDKYKDENEDDEKQ